MPETRRSARLGASSQGSQESSPAKPSTSGSKGTKRKAQASDASPARKKGTKAQKTIEETMPDVEGENDKDVEMKDRVKEAEDDEENEDSTEDSSDEGPADAKPEEKAEETKPDAESKEALAENTGDADGAPKEAAEDTTTESATRDEQSTQTIPKDDAKALDKDDDASKQAGPAKDDKPAKVDESETEDLNKSSGDTKSESNGKLIQEQHARDGKIASNIIEKGIIYFFTRGRVNIENPESVQDLQRSFFVLRPIPIGAKLGDGPIDDSKSNRLLAVPKKVFPESGKDRFMAFVEKAKVSMSELKEDFFQGNDYETKAGDKRHTPSVTPVGEGVYAITEVGRGSHLAYMLTIPGEPGKLQHDLGIYSKGSFALSLKNPKNKGPANTQLPQSPGFPESIMNDFRGLAWMPVHKSEYLDYPNAQLLLIGEGADRFGGGAVQAPEGEENKSPEKELEKLEGEDEERVEALGDEDAVFEDLHISKGEFPKVPTTW